MKCLEAVNKKNIRFIFFMMALVFMIIVGGCATGQQSRSVMPIVMPSSIHTDAEIAARFNLTLDQVSRLHSMRGLSNDSIVMLSPKALEKSLRKIEKPKSGFPGEAVKWRMGTLVDENGEIPPDAMARALKQAKEIQPPRSSRIWGRTAVSEPSGIAGLTADSWRWLGPGNIGGRIRSCVIHPEKTDTMWVGSVAGGIWTTSNGGESWKPVDDFMSNLSVCTMVMHPTDYDVMFAGTGEGFYNGDAIRGAGVFMSIDGGATWNHLESTEGSDWYFVNRLSFAPDGSALLAATGRGLFRSIDNGESWERVFSGRMLDVKFDPSDGMKAIATETDFTDFTATLPYYSTDGGVSWEPAKGISSGPAFYGRIELAYAPSDPDIVYASQDVDSGTIYYSSDGGHTYTYLHSGSYYLGAQGWYDNAIWVDPTDPLIFIVGGIDLYRYDLHALTITQISKWWESPESAHADHHFIIAHPQFEGEENKTVYFCNDGGIYKTDDVYTVEGVDGWQEINNNLGVTQFYGGAGNPQTGVIVGGAQDVGTLSYTGDTEGWVELFGGDGGFCAADPDNSSIFYGEYVFLNIFRNNTGAAPGEEDDWADWYINGRYVDSEDAWAWRDEPYMIPDSKNQEAAFIAPFLLDPNDSSRILAGGRQLWRTNDPQTPSTPTTGPSWQSIKSAIGNTSSANITAIAVAEGDSDIVWVGYENGIITRTDSGTDDAPYWQRVGSGVLPMRRCMRILLHPYDPDTAYVAFGGFSSSNIFKTIDGGQSWADITGSSTTGLPDAPVRDLTLHPDNPDWIYAGTEVGIFASQDAGATWSVTNAGPTNCSVDDLFWIGTTLVAATHGRGLFEIDIPCAIDGALKLLPDTFNSGLLFPRNRFVFITGPEDKLISSSDAVSFDHPSITYVWSVQSSSVVFALISVLPGYGPGVGGDYDEIAVSVGCYEGLLKLGSDLLP